MQTLGWLWRNIRAALAGGYRGGKCMAGSGWRGGWCVLVLAMLPIVAARREVLAGCA